MSLEVGLTTLGDRLRRWRRARGLSQAQLGEQAGLSGRFVSAVETGQQGRGVRADTLYQLAQALGCRMETLLNRPWLMEIPIRRKDDGQRKDRR